MTLYLWEGQLLIRGAFGGGLAIAEECCCVEEGEGCGVFPSTIYAHTSFCGTSVITLSELPDNDVPGIGGVDGQRWWYGSGVFGGGPGTMQIALACSGDDGGTLWVCIDACAGSFACGGSLTSGWSVLTDLSSTSPFGTHSGVPMSLCNGSCMEDWTITFRDSL